MNFAAEKLTVKKMPMHQASLPGSQGKSCTAKRTREISCTTMQMGHFSVKIMPSKPETQPFSDINSIINSLYVINI